MATAPALDSAVLLDEALIRRFISDTIGQDIHLVSIQPDGFVDGAWFGDDAPGATEWAVDQNQRGRGVYWTVNVARARLDKKPTKRDIVAARFLHVDIDPPFDRKETLAKLTEGKVPPSFIIDSGNGLQAFWRLDYRAENMSAVEDLNQRLAAECGGDHCHNIDRPMRLPGTVNYPNALKRSRGRIPTLSIILEEDAGEGVDPADLDALLPQLPPSEKAEREPVKLDGLEPVSLADLGITTLNKLHMLIVQPPNPDRSRATYAVACEMVRQGFDDKAIAGVLLNPELPISAHCLGQASPRRAISRSIEGARAEVRVEKPRQGDSGGSDDQPERPVIHVEAGRLHIMATEAEDALIASETPFFVRGGIVRPILDEMQASHGRTTKVARLAPVEAATLVDHLSRVADWRKFNIRKKDDVATDPPLQVAQTILSRDGEWRLRKLAGVVTTQTLRPDGSLLAVAGYDPQTRLLLLNPPALPPIPDEPTKDQAAEALTLLNGLLDGFPFVDLASRSVALSALITPVVRGAMPVAPLHATTAPVAGSGKSFLIDIASAILTGERAPVIAAGRTEEETEKRLGAALLSGQPIVTIDNVNGQLGGDALCQLIERPVVSVRPLGVSKLVKIESRASTFATGNNIQLVGDMTRRVVLCSLDPDMERPELRVFRFSPFQSVVEDRGKYVHAALLIVRAYISAGCPDPLPALASFEQWSLYVRSALVWLGQADPCDTMEAARGDDPVTASLRALFNAWYRSLSSDALSTGKVKATADTRDPFGNPVNQELLQALVDVAEGRSGGVDTKRLGHFLSRHHGRIVDGLKLSAEEDGHSKQKLWRVARVARV